jgi:xylulokinase
MKAEPLVLAIDLGTTTCKTLAVDSSLRIVFKEAVEYPVSTPRAGWAEQDPATWWSLVKGSMSKAAASLDARQIRAIGLSGQMHGLVLLDKACKPLRPAILWNDQRSAPQCAQIYEQAGGVEGLLRYTDNPMLPGYTGGKILWVRENEPRTFEKTDRFCLPKDYLRYRMTGEIATDVSDASGTGLFDVRRKDWAFELVEKLGIPAGWLPRACESTEFLGEIPASLAAETGLKAGTPVSAGGGDAVMQTVGSGAIDSEIVLLVIGTGGNVTVSLPKPIDNPGASLQIFCHVLPDQWTGMGVTLSAGSSLKWFRDRLAGLEKALAPDLGVSAYEMLNLEAAGSPPGANGLIFLPYLQGERAPYADANARGAFIGLGLHHQKADMVRAVLEGVAFSLRDVLDLILKAGIQPVRVHASGGGSSSSVWRQILADVFNRSVTTLDYSEDAGAIGAAIVAGVSAGLWKSASQATALIQTRTLDQPEPGNPDIYAKYLAIYKSLYPVLKPGFDALAGIV